MARKPAHAPGELREIILKEATLLIEEKGLSGLSAREIAKRISYSPGTIYNSFKNLDDVILTIESRLLDRLDEQLKRVSQSQDGQSFILNMALAYLQFTQENRNLWNVLFEHHLEADASPGWYQEKLDGLMANIERALVPSMPGASDTEIRRAARVLWAGVHGITSLASANKLANVSTDGAQILIKDLVNTYEAGLGSRRKDGRSQFAEAS